MYKRQGRLTYLESLNRDAPLLEYELLQPLGSSSADNRPLLERALTPCPSVLAWLLGNYQPAAQLAASVRIHYPSQHLIDESYVTDGIVAAQAWSALAEAIQEQPILCFFGPNQEARAALSRLLASSVSQPLLTLDLSESQRSGVAPRRALMLALRDARLTGAITYIDNWEACIENDNIPKDLSLIHI